MARNAFWRRLLKQLGPAGFFTFVLAASLVGVMSVEARPGGNCPCSFPQIIDPATAVCIVASDRRSDVALVEGSAELSDGSATLFCEYDHEPSSRSETAVLTVSNNQCSFFHISGQLKRQGYSTGRSNFTRLTDIATPEDLTACLQDVIDTAEHACSTGAGTNCDFTVSP